MATVKYGDLIYECSKVIKGSDYVHLLDSDGSLIVSIDGITSFSGITFTGGYSIPAAAGNCDIAVVMTNGTMGNSGVKACDVFTNYRAIELASGTHYGTSLPSSGTEGQLFFKLVE